MEKAQSRKVAGVMNRPVAVLIVHWGPLLVVEQSNDRREMSADARAPLFRPRASATGKETDRLTAGLPVAAVLNRVLPKVGATQ
jgi:hypothetical protein